jgi:hypothetical protein
VIDGTNVLAHRCAAGAKGGSITEHWAEAVAGLATSKRRFCPGKAAGTGAQPVDPPSSLDKA